MQFILMLSLTSSDGTYDYSLHNKQTGQSSTNRNRDSSLAVDGGTGTDSSRGSCVQTKKDTNPWWAVDMGELVTVYSVDITNRNIYGVLYI